MTDTRPRYDTRESPAEWLAQIRREHSWAVRPFAKKPAFTIVVAVTLGFAGAIVGDAERRARRARRSVPQEMRGSPGHRSGRAADGPRGRAPSHPWHLERLACVLSAKPTRLGAEIPH